MTASEPLKTKTASADSAIGGMDPRTQQALDRIKAALSRRKGDDAVRFFKEASSVGLIPGDGDVLAWLQETLGTEPTDMLMNAYAVLSCFYCNKGIVACEDCKGRGHEPDGTLCSKCLALGIDRCDFCAGSGWFTINHVPHVLQPGVILRRVVNAGKEAEAVLSAPIPVVLHGEPAGARKLGAKLLLQVNRLLGVLENMAVGAGKLATQNAEAANVARKTIAACEAIAPRLQERAGKLLGVLAEAATVEAGITTRSASRRMAERRAAFYGGLATSKSFAGTLLRRPFIFSVDPPMSPSGNSEVATDTRSDES